MQQQAAKSVPSFISRDELCVGENIGAKEEGKEEYMIKRMGLRKTRFHLSIY